MDYYLIYIVNLKQQMSSSPRTLTTLQSKSTQLSDTWLIRRMNSCSLDEDNKKMSTMSLSRYSKVAVTKHPLSYSSASPYTRKTQTTIKIVGPNSLTFEGRQNSSPSYSKKHR